MTGTLAVLPAEVTTVADDEIVLCYPAELAEPSVAPALGGAHTEPIFPPDTLRPARLVRFTGLAPATECDCDGYKITTLPRPAGELLATFATVNDLHFGEEVCGHLGKVASSPVLRRPDGAVPHAEMMNACVAAEIAAIDPDVVIAKGDITDSGDPADFERFEETYRGAVGGRLRHVRGNHDTKEGARIEGNSVDEVVLPGVILALIDTTIPGEETGTVHDDQIEWLDELGARADRPVLVMGHHHPAEPATREPGSYYFGIEPAASAALVDVIARRPRIVGYFAGHTHRNRVRRFTGTGDVPYVEVGATKDFPGSWAEYRVFEGGILQIHRRAGSTEALEWSEACRLLYGRNYPAYALGSIEDRCFSISPRPL